MWWLLNENITNITRASPHLFPSLLLLLLVFLFLLSLTWFNRDRRSDDEKGYDDADDDKQKRGSDFSKLTASQLHQELYRRNLPTHDDRGVKLSKSTAIALLSLEVGDYDPHCNPTLIVGRGGAKIALRLEDSLARAEGFPSTIARIEARVERFKQRIERLPATDLAFELKIEMMRDDLSNEEAWLSEVRESQTGGSRKDVKKGDRLA